MGRRNRILLRELYLQNLENEQRTDHIISNDNPNIIAPVSGIRRTSRKRFFQNLDVEGTSADFEDRRAYKSEELDAIANALDSSSSFGQAHYQRRKQGVVIEYKDFGDDTFECAHCNAYYWRDEMNTRGVYTGCCKGGQLAVSVKTLFFKNLLSRQDKDEKLSTSTPLSIEKEDGLDQLMSSSCESRKSLNLEENIFLNKLLGEKAQMRAKFNFYPRCPRADKVFGLKPHTDGSGMTVLLQDKEVEGLQVLVDGKWVRVPIVPHAIVVNLGDQMQIMSNGIFKSPMHRVVTNPDRMRLYYLWMALPLCHGSLT